MNNKKSYPDCCRDYICFDCRVRIHGYESNIRERERLEREMEYLALESMLPSGFEFFGLMFLIMILGVFISKAFFWLLKFWITSEIIVGLMTGFITFVVLIGFSVWFICYSFSQSNSNK